MPAFARSPSHSGFTLIEVVVAIAVGGFVIVTAHRMLTIIADTAGRVPSRAFTVGRARNDARLLRELVARADIGMDTTRWFVGTADSARFDSRCMVGGGWLEPCVVVLRIVSHSDSASLEMTAAGRVIPLVTRSGSGRMSYLRTTNGGRDRLERWNSAHSLPLGLQIEIGDSVLFLRIGDRG